MNAADIPYDVLAEIFLFCLPSNPLEIEQPDTSQAPMLLCQICSAWRSVALSTPRLWIYLSYTLGTQSTRTIGPILTSEVLEFLQWWRSRLHTMPLFLRLSSSRRFEFFRDMNPKQIKFLLDLISSAHYLNLDVCCNMALIELDKYEVVSFTNLDTLVLTNSGLYDKWGANYLHYSYRAAQETHLAFPISSNTINTLRHLVMDPRHISMHDFQKPAITWSNITTLYACIIAELRVWFLLIRECVSMVSGHIVLSSGPPKDVPTNPARKTLPQLRELVIRGSEVASMLLNLSLPNLSTLRIDDKNLSVDEINRILTSTPALTKLQLSPNMVVLDEGAFIPGDIAPNSVPLCSIVPELQSIHFGGHLQGNHDIFKHPSVVVRAFLGRWLGLGTPANNITHLEFSSDNRTNEQCCKS